MINVPKIFRILRTEGNVASIELVNELLDQLHGAPRRKKEINRIGRIGFTSSKQERITG
jgi:hypothetical protein